MADIRTAQLLPLSLIKSNTGACGITPQGHDVRFDHQAGIYYVELTPDREWAAAQIDSDIVGIKMGTDAYRLLTVMSPLVTIRGVSRGREMALAFVSDKQKNEDCLLYFMGRGQAVLVRTNKIETIKVDTFPLITPNGSNRR